MAKRLGAPLRKEGRNSRTENIKAVVRILESWVFGELYFGSKAKAGNVSIWDGWKTSSSGIQLYIRFSIISKKRGALSYDRHTFQLDRTQNK